MEHQMTSLYDDIMRSVASAADNKRLRAVVNACVRSLTPPSAALPCSMPVHMITDCEYNECGMPSEKLQKHWLFVLVVSLLLNKNA